MCRAINRLETIVGTIEIDGTKLPKKARRWPTWADVGMVFQSFNLFAHKTILENVTLGPIKVRKKSPAEAKNRGMELLKRVGVDGRQAAIPAQLSGGQQQRVAIAGRWPWTPRVEFIFDEPTSALDPPWSTRCSMPWSAFQKQGMTMIVVTHEMGSCKAANRVMFMADRRGERPERPSSPAPSHRAQDFLSKILTH